MEYAFHTAVTSKQNTISISHKSTIDSHQHHWVKIMMKQIIHSFTIPSPLNHSSLFILHRLTPPSLSKNYSEENYSFIYNSLTPHSLIQTKWYQKQYLSSLDSHHHHRVKTIMKRIIYFYTIHSHLNHSSKQNENIHYLSTIDSHDHLWEKL